MAVRINHPTRVRVKPLGEGKKKTQVFEMITVQGKEPVLRALGDFIKAGGEVTLVEISECTVDDCPCKLGRIMGRDPSKTLVMILSEVDIEPVN